MADARIWAQRVKAWRASGETAGEFAAGEDFAAATLRYWAWRLNKAEAARPARFVRLVPRVEAAKEERPGDAASMVVTIEVGGARVIVGTGFDRAALRDVLAVLREAGPAT